MKMKQMKTLTGKSRRKKIDNYAKVNEWHGWQPVVVTVGFGIMTLTSQCRRFDLFTFLVSIDFFPMTFRWRVIDLDTKKFTHVSYGFGTRFCTRIRARFCTRFWIKFRWKLWRSIQSNWYRQHCVNFLWMFASSVPKWKSCSISGESVATVNEINQSQFQRPNRR